MTAKFPRFGRAALGVGLALGLTSGSGSAWGQDLFCTAPIKPACLSLQSTFERSVAIDRCKQSVEDYVTETESYKQCLSDLMGNADTRADAIAREFECRVQGGTDCTAEASEP